MKKVEVDDGFSETVGTLARAADLAQETVRRYSDLGLLEHTRLENGVRLFRPSAVEKVKAIYTERMARRGRRAVAG